MPLNTNQIIALQQLPGIGVVAIMKIGDYIHEKGISVSDAATLYDVCKVVLQKKFEKFSVSEIENALAVSEEIKESSEKRGISVVGYWDADFPVMLKNVTDEEGKSKPCVLLFYKGNLNALKKPGFAIIGTREPDEDGQKAGPYFAHAFAQQGLNIVSGLALGCDTMAHRGALAVGGTTTAFLAHGLDMVYPPENESLAKEIIENGGLLLSEYPIGTQVSRYNLVARDRLQSALSQACLVIETGLNGGTMHVARATLAANKPLFAVRYSDKSADKKQGNEWLFSQGAIPLTSQDDIAKIAKEIKVGKTNITNSQLDLFA